MVKKKSSNWLTWVIAVIALVALILAIVSISHTSNVTGNGIFDWFKKDRVQTKVQEIENNYNGLLTSNYDFSSNPNPDFLKGYEVKYDNSGKMIYEVIDNIIWEGEGYTVTKDEISGQWIASSNEGNQIYQVGGNGDKKKGSCVCSGEGNCRPIRNFSGKCKQASHNPCNGECSRELSSQ